MGGGSVWSTGDKMLWRMAGRANGKGTGGTGRGGRKGSLGVTVAERGGKRRWAHTGAGEGETVGVSGRQEMRGR